jgi:hypothetical protein
MWSYVTMGGLALALLGFVFFWFRYRENQAVERQRQATEIVGLKNALARCEAARKLEKHGRADVARRLDELRPVGGPDPPPAA